MKYHAFSLGFLLAAFMLPVYAAEQTAVGKISFAKGSNAAQQPNAAPRLLGKDAEIYQGDNIQTSDESFVIVEFTDGSKVTVRPNSNFKIEQFDSTNKNAKFTVYEGGVRASTGEFAKAGADNFQIKTPTATLKGEKESDYSVRVCKDDCDKDKKAEPAKDTSVAKVVDIKGNVFAQNRMDKNAEERKLTIGGGLNPKDYLTSQANSYVVMVFRDGEKVTLQPNSELDIVKYDYQQAGKKDQMLFKLAAGGMRALTGSIGKKDHGAYALDTPVATIGIRGTESETVIDDSVDVSTGHAPVYNHVTEGSISVRNEAGETVLGQGQSSITSSQNTPTIQVPTLPPKVTNQLSNTPSPKTAPDPDKAFEKPAASSKSGTYATVNKGSAKLESNKSEKSDKVDKSDKSSSPEEKSASSDKGSSEKSDNKSAAPTAASNDDSGSDGGTSSDSGTTLSEGESSFAGESSGETTKLDETPTFIAQDDTPAPTEFSNNSPAMGATFSPLNDSNTKGGAGCAVE
jgi:hypothetical protein